MSILEPEFVIEEGALQAKNWHTLAPCDRKIEVQRLQAYKLRQVDIGKLMGASESAVHSLCKKYKLVGLSVGAQKGNKNAVMDGMGRNTIRRLTKRVLQSIGRDLYICERCNKKDVFGEELPRHHKDRDRSNNHPDNLEVLCRSCHSTEHLNDRPRTIEGKFS